VPEAELSVRSEVEVALEGDSFTTWFPRGRPDKLVEAESESGRYAEKKSDEALKGVNKEDAYAKQVDDGHGRSSVPAPVKVAWLANG
jgi:hypothetical protein